MAHFFLAFLALISITSADNQTLSPTTPTTSTPTTGPTISLAPSTASPVSSSPSHSPSSSPSSQPTSTPTSTPTETPTTAVPTSFSLNLTSLPVGKYQTACLPLGPYFQRITIDISPPPSPGQSNGLIYTVQLFVLSPNCTAFDAQVVSTASYVDAYETGANEANLDVFVSKVTVTVANVGLVGLFGSCDGGGWVANTPRVLNQSCIVANVAIPAPRDCPVFYSRVQYNATSVKIADLFTRNGTNISCSSSHRYTNVSSANFQLSTPTNSTPYPPTCEQVSNASICAPFIDYPVSVPGCSQSCSTVQCQKLELEKDLFVSVLPQVWSVLNSSSCRKSVASLLCSNAFKRCGPQQPLCSSACDTVVSSCSSDELNTFNRLLSVVTLSVSTFCTSSSSCSAPPALPTLPLPGLENAVPQSTLTPTLALSYPTCAQYDGQACKGLVTYSVYVPDKKTLYDMEQTFEKQIWFAFGLAPRGACYDAFTRMSCATIFNRCDLTAMDAALGSGTPVPVPLPRLPCRSLCQVYNDTCSKFIALANSTLTRDCWARDNSNVGCDSVTPGKYITTPTGKESYPANLTVILSTPKVETYCNGLFDVAEGVQAPLMCPYPLIVPESPIAPTINDGHCALPCDSVYKHPWATPGWNRFFSGCLVLSFVASVFTATTYIVFRERLLRTQTQIYAFHTILSTTLSAIIPMPGVVWNPATAVTSVTCIDNTREMTFADPVCGITGVMMVFATTTQGFFLTAFVFDLYLVVSMHNQRMSKETRDKMAKWTFICIYSYAVAFVIMSVIADKIRHNGLPFCFVYAWASDFFWIVMCGAMLVDVICFALVCRSIYMSRKRTAVLASSKDSNKKSNRSLASQYRRPIAFTMLCMLLFCIAIVARLQARVRADEFATFNADWFQCNVIRSHVTGEQCAQYPLYLNPYFLWITITVICSQGFIISFIFGFSGQNYRLWRDLFRSRVFPKIGCLARYAAKSSNELDSSLHEGSTSTHHFKSRDSSNKALRALARAQSATVQMSEPSTPRSDSDSLSSHRAATENDNSITPTPRPTPAPVSPTSPSMNHSTVGSSENSQVEATKTLHAAKVFHKPRKPKASKPTARTLFVPVGNKLEFVPFD